MKGVYITLITIGLFIFGVYSQTDYVTSWSYEGMEVIFNNQTSFLDQLGHYNGSLYASGAGFIHKIIDGPTFELSYDPYFPEGHPFLAFDTFSDVDGRSWVFGPTTNRFFNATRSGLIYPLMISGKNRDGTHPVTQTEYLPGNYLMSACAWGNTTVNRQRSGYFVGWEADNSTGYISAAFTVIRTAINTDNIGLYPTSKVFDFVNKIVLHREGYTAFNRDYKPWIFHSSYSGLAIVVDPASYMIYRIHTPADPNEPMTYDHAVDSFQIAADRRLSFATSAAYDYQNGFVWVGISSEGIFPGRLLQIDVNSMKQHGFIELKMGESNPISITFDARPGQTPSLYVAFFGSHHIAKYHQETHEELGYITLPPSFNSVYGIVNYNNYIHFITNDQFGKVGRIPLENVCPTVCDSFNHGYCSKGKCSCSRSGLVLDGNNRCVPQITTKVEKERGGEIALGILFAIVFVVACVGWYLVWKSRKNTGYTSIENRG